MKKKFRELVGQIRPTAVRTIIVLLGIFVGQVILYGPSLIGQKILLPLDLLAQPGRYIPINSETRKIVSHNEVLSDLVFLGEPQRRFCATEFHAGRWPCWTPYQNAGSFLMCPMFSPFWILKLCFFSPIVLAWAQVVLSLVIGGGAYLFCRRILQVGFWSAAIVAWCYPLTGFFVLWQGYSVSESVAWLPWILLAVDVCVRQPSALGGAVLAVLTCLVLVSGQLDVAGQVLLASGLFALWSLIDEYYKQWDTRRVFLGIAATVTAWLLGFMLAAPYLLPMLEYSQTGSRMARRSQGTVERPPIGLKALPQILFPYVYGTEQTGSIYIVEGNLLESSAAAYTGLLATLLLAPLAWCSRRHLSLNVFWMLFGFFGLAWSLNLPGVVNLLRMSLMNMMSHNRLVFCTSFAILSMAAVGLDVLFQGAFTWRKWCWLPVVLLASLGIWCIVRAVDLPEPIASQLAVKVRHGDNVIWIHDLTGVRETQRWFISTSAVSAVLCGFGVLGWLLLWFWPKAKDWLAPALGAFMVGDLLWFSYGISAQCDPTLYYPRIPVLQQIAAENKGRIVGVNCLPAILSQSHNLRDIRGYDGVDPIRLMELMDIAADPRSPKLSYALTQRFIPRLTLKISSGIRLSPVLDMLAVRYVVFRGSPPTGVHADFTGEDYWALINRQALSRVYVPRRVETVADEKQRLQRLSATNFQPDQVAYVEIAVDLPRDCSGSASIVDEIPTRITVSVNMTTPGLVVLADLWDKGWKAYLDGKPVPILRTNHALRGVIVPAGNAILEFRYNPTSFNWGVVLAGLALTILLIWIKIKVVFNYYT